MAHFKEATLNPDPAIPGEVYAAIANAQLEGHPFKDGHPSLNDLMAVLHEIRNLPDDAFTSCIRALLETVMAVSHDGCNCYGRGLVFLRHATFGRDATIESVATELLKAATHVCPPPDGIEQRSPPPYEETFAARLQKLGIAQVPGYEPVLSPEQPRNRD